MLFVIKVVGMLRMNLVVLLVRIVIYILFVVRLLMIIGCWFKWVGRKLRVLF